MIFIIQKIHKIYAIFLLHYIYHYTRMLKHYNITVTGKVQGVWYRKSTWIKAEELRIKGYVMNLPNGSVYIEAEGDQNQLQNLLKWCSEGPEYAIVDHISFKESNMQFFEHFMILR